MRKNKITRQKNKKRKKIRCKKTKKTKEDNKYITRKKTQTDQKDRSCKIHDENDKLRNMILKKEVSR